MKKVFAVVDAADKVDKGEIFPVCGAVLHSLFM